MKANIPYLTLLYCLIPRISCSSNSVEDQKHHNEVIINIDELFNINNPNIKEVSPEENENVASNTLKEKTDLTQEENLNQKENYNVFKDSGSVESINKNSNLELLRKAFSNLELNLMDKEEDLDKEMSLPYEISVSEGLQTRPHGIDLSHDSNEDVEILRLKKNTPQVKYSEPRPFYYYNQDPISGSYRFGYGSRDQYRTETRTTDGTVKGSFGWRDDTGKWHDTNYIADKFGYRVFPPSQEAGPPLIFPPPAPPPSPEAPPPSIPVSFKYQPINPHSEDNSVQQEKEPRGSEHENNQFNPFHSIDFSGNDFHRRNGGYDVIKSSPDSHGNNKYRYPFKPLLDKNSFHSYLSPNIPKKKSKITKEPTITVTDLQDRFFYGLPLKHTHDSFPPKLDNVYETFTPQNFLKYPRRKTWPAIVERVSKPLIGRFIKARNKETRGKRMNDKIQQKRFVQMEDSKTAQSVPNSGFDNNYILPFMFPPSLKCSVGVKMNLPPFSAPININNNPGFSVTKLSNKDILVPVSIIDSLSHLDPYFTSVILPGNHQLLYQLPTNFDLYPTASSVLIPAFPVSQFQPIPLSQSQYHHPFSSLDLQKELLNTYHPAASFIHRITYPSFTVQSKPSSKKSKETNRGKNKPKSKTEIKTKTGNKINLDSIDYLLLSDEFKEINGSIKNDPAFGNLKDHFNNKIKMNSSKTTLQEKENNMEDFLDIIDDMNDTVTNENNSTNQEIIKPVESDPDTKGDQQNDNPHIESISSLNKTHNEITLNINSLINSGNSRF